MSTYPAVVCWLRVGPRYAMGDARMPRGVCDDATLGWWGPDGARRLVVATADPATLPAQGHLVSGHEPNLPRPGGPREADNPTRPRAWRVRRQA